MHCSLLPCLLLSFVGLGGETPDTASDPAELAPALEQLDGLRHGKDTSLQAVQSQGQTLLREHADPKEQGQIYFHLTDVLGQSGMQHPEQIIDYAQRALNCPLEPSQRLRLYIYWGDALRIADRRPEAFPAVRKRAVVPYLQGLKESQHYAIPETRPELPGVDRYDIPEGAPGFAEAERKHEAQWAARKEAEFFQGLWNRRRVLINQIVDIYSEPPLAASELRHLATRILDNPTSVARLMQAIEEKGALKDDSSRPPSDP